MIAYTIEKFTDINEIVNAGVMPTPALAIDGKVLSQGKILAPADIAKHLSSYERLAGQRHFVIPIRFIDKAMQRSCTKSTAVSASKPRESGAVQLVSGSNRPWTALLSEVSSFLC